MKEVARLSTVTQVRFPLVAAILALACTASAQLRLSVRAESELSLSAFVGDDGIHARIRLEDDLGAPIQGAEVRILGTSPSGGCGSPPEVRTDAGGRGEIVLDRRCVGSSLSAAYAGDRLREADSVEATIAPVPPEGDLVVRLPGGPRLDLDRPMHLVEIRAPEGMRAAGVRVRIVDELARELVEGRLDRSGVFSAELPSARLGPPGAGRLVASAEVGGEVDARRTLVPIVRYRATRLVLEEVADPEAPIAVRGRLSDSRGGIARQAIAIVADGRPIGASETDSDGAFHFRSTDRPPGQGTTVRVHASYSASQPGRSDARSPTLAIALERRPGLPDPWFLLPIVIALLAVLRSLARPGAPAVPEPSREAVELARRPLAARADRRDLVVTVSSRRDGTPLEGAVVRILDPDGEVRSTSAEGGARFEGLPDGRLEVEISAPRHARVRFAASIPHRGELGGIRVRLTSLRDRALDAFEPIAADVLGDPEGLGRSTVRDVAARGEASGLPGDLPSDVERLAFAAPAPEEHEVEHVAERAQRFLANRKRGPQSR